jgi:nucleotide-binding universal stress UspA family protein
MAIKTILVPTDFSKPSQSALSYAKEIADGCGASLRVLHVVEFPVLPYGYADIYPPPPQEYFDQVERAAGEHLKASMSDEDCVKYRVERVLLRGRPAYEILKYLEHALDIDLVVMATHGRGAMGRFMMGSVADKIVREAPCPVLTLRGKALHRAADTHAA